MQNTSQNITYAHRLKFTMQRPGETAEDESAPGPSGWIELGTISSSGNAKKNKKLKKNRKMQNTPHNITYAHRLKFTMQRPGETVEDESAPGPSGVAGTLKFEHKRMKP